MLVDTELAQFSVLVQYRRAPQTSNDVQVIDERLVGTETEGNVNVEEIVGSSMLRPPMDASSAAGP